MGCGRKKKKLHWNIRAAFFFLSFLSIKPHWLSRMNDKLIDSLESAHWFSLRQAKLQATVHFHQNRLHLNHREVLTYAVSRTRSKRNISALMKIWECFSFEESFWTKGVCIWAKIFLLLRKESCNYPGVLKRVSGGKGWEGKGKKEKRKEEKGRQGEEKGKDREGKEQEDKKRNFWENSSHDSCWRSWQWKTFLCTSVADRSFPERTGTTFQIRKHHRRTIIS